MRLIYICGAILSSLILAGCETTPQSSQSEDLSPVAATVGDVSPVGTYEEGLLRPPLDPELLAEHALFLSTKANRQSDPTDARNMRKRSRGFAHAALSAGSDNVLLSLLLDGSDEDGNLIEVLYHDNPAVNALMASGEKKFARGDMKEALHDYTRALELDPHFYKAALYIGDVHFSRMDYAEALVWFDRAIKIEPYLETAHRYRADSLMHLRRANEAGDSYITAFIVNPYQSKLSFRALQHWAQQQGTPFVPPPPSIINGSLIAQDGKLALNYNPSLPSSELSLIYLLARSKYYDDSGEPVSDYQHTMAEEVSALQTCITVYQELMATADGAAKLKPHKTFMERLVKINDRGLLEAHVYLERATQDIANSYLSFLENDQDLLKRYVRSFLLERQD